MLKIWPLRKFNLVLSTLLMTHLALAQGTFNFFEDPVNTHFGESQHLWNDAFLVNQIGSNLGLDFRQNRFAGNQNLSTLDISYAWKKETAEILPDSSIAWGLSLRYHQANFYTEQFELKLQAARSFFFGEGVWVDFGIGLGVGNRLINFQDGPIFDTMLSTKEGKFFPDLSLGAAFNFGPVVLSASSRHIAGSVLKYSPHYQPKVNELIFLQGHYSFQSGGVEFQPYIHSRWFANKMVPSDFGLNATVDAGLELLAAFRTNLGNNSLNPSASDNFDVIIAGASFTIFENYQVGFSYEWPLNQDVPAFKGAAQTSLRWLGQ